MKKILLLSLLLLPGISYRLAAQQNIVYSQYIYNGLLINPAYAGSHVQLSATLSYRNQWVNFEGAPQTATLGVHTAMNKSKVGLGLLATSDKIGIRTNDSGLAAIRIRVFLEVMRTGYKTDVEECSPWDSRQVSIILRRTTRRLN